MLLPKRRQFYIEAVTEVCRAMIIEVGANILTELFLLHQFITGRNTLVGAPLMISDLTLIAGHEM